MKHLRIISAILILALILSSGATVCAEEIYHMVLVPNPDRQTIVTMLELGLPMDDSKMIKGEGLEIPLEEAEIALLRQNNIAYSITQRDLEAYYAKICNLNMQQIPSYQTDDPVHMKYGSMGGFYNMQEIIMDLDSMLLLYPNLITQRDSIGAGHEGNPIWMVKISDNPNVTENEPAAIYDALHHAREPGSYTVLMYFMWDLLEGYGTDPELTYLVNNRELYFVPVVNPDGFLYNIQTNPGGGGSWRKNRRNNGGTYGVDLNRNYSYQWGYNNQGSSGNPGSSTYRGPSAASEPETQAMMNLINPLNFKTGMTIHTSSGVYITAYGYANVMPESLDIHMEYLAEAARYNTYSYGTCYQIMYSSNGRTQDWQLHEHGIINVEPEVGTHGFWPSIQYIMPEAAENQNCCRNIAWCAGGKVDYNSTVVADGYLSPGDLDTMMVEVFNRGMSVSEPINFTLATTDPFITLLDSAASSDTISYRSSAFGQFRVQTAPNCSVGHEAEFTVTINQGGFLREQEFSLIVGTPYEFFADDAENGMGNWNATGGWGLCSSDPHWGSFSFADSPTGSYSNNTTRVMTLSQPVDLSQATSAWLEFWGKWDIEARYDFCQLEVSTNGTSYTPMQGLYTVAGSGRGAQPSGQPGYHGSQLTWVKERINLNSYAGQSNLWFRFELRSDQGVTGDGFFVDDIKLLGFAPSAGPNISVTLTPLNPPINIPANGGTFDFTVTIVNNEATPLTFTGWTDVQLPNGNIYGPIILRTGIIIPAGGTIQRTSSQFVPASAPGGQYHYRGHIGPDQSTIWDEDSFGFVKFID